MTKKNCFEVAKSFARGHRRHLSSMILSTLVRRHRRRWFSGSASIGLNKKKISFKNQPSP